MEIMARVMIADDSESVRLTLKDMVEAGKHKVVSEAVDGIDALEKFDSVKPDVLLLDVAMPKKDGLETLIEIIKYNPQAKIVMITAHDDMDLIENCIKVGALAYITKPFNTDEIIKVISYAFEEK
jgi:two-component system, chemotaxis family, chemotaxis protein CheY